METGFRLISENYHEIFNLISDVITRRDVGFKSFRYIKKFDCSGLTNSNYVYNIVNFQLERALESLPVEEWFDDFELVLIR